ncbi:MAG: hypothetical protein J5569_04035 [Oscillospiraceae bacterium]|nr:hypothetical protein [Oscillospiraceae bacterium]
MGDYEKDLAACLSDAGLSGETVSEAVRLCEAGRKEDLIRYLRVKRCSLIEELHESQKKIDRFDYMIRQTEKQIYKERRDQS